MATHDRTPFDPKSGQGSAPRERERERERERGRGRTAAPNAGPDALSILAALRRRWLLAGVLGLFLAGLAAVGAYLAVPARYTGFALLQVSSRPGGFIDRAEARTEFSTYLRTSAARLKSRDVLMRTLSQDQVRHLRLVQRHPDTLSTLTWMEENLKVDFQEGSELLNVGLTGDEPDDLVVIVNALVKSYLGIIQSQEKSQRKDRADKVRLLYEAAKEKLGEKVAAREALLRGQGAKDVLSMQQRQLNVQSQMQRAQENLAQYQYELERKQAQFARLEATKKSLEAATIDNPLREVHESDARLKQLAADWQRAERWIDDLQQAGHGNDDLTLLLYRKRAAVLKKQVEERTEMVKAEMLQKHKQRMESDLGNADLALKSEILPLENHVRKLQERVDSLAKDVEHVTYSTAKQNLLETEIHQEEKNVAQLFDAFKRAQIEEESEPRITPIGEAELQNRDVRKRLATLGGAPLVAFLLGLLAVGWWEYSARRIHGPAEVASTLSLRVLGAVPEMPDMRRRKGLDPQAAELYRHHLIESIDAIRTLLLRSANTEALRVVMVTSAVSGEGKTTLSSNLAMSLARAGRRTLLVDCDLRQPAAHQLFEQTLQPGFSEAVLGEVPLADAVRQTTLDPNLALLPAGHWDREVLQELAKPGTTNLFSQLREEFDFIIVDSHPVLSATDSLLIAQHADAVMVSLMRDVSQMHLAQSACDQLAELNVRVFGAVVHGMPVRDYRKTPAVAQAA